VFTIFCYNLNKFSITLNLSSFILPGVTTSNEAKAKLIYRIAKPIKTKIISTFQK